MQLIIKPDGTIHGVYSDDFDYKMLGETNIRRASHVEPDELGRWFADLSPVGGPKLGPFDRRKDALNAEIVQLERMMTEQDFAG